MVKKSKNTDNTDELIAEITGDLQRTRADFENFRKRVESDKIKARTMGEEATVLRLLPTIDIIDRATENIPKELADHAWVKGIQGARKKLDQAMTALEVKQIPAKQGELFDPELHEAIQFDEESEGESEVIAELLQPGYTFKGNPIRHAMVKVERR